MIGTARRVAVGTAREAAGTRLRAGVRQRTRQLLVDAAGLAVAAVMLFPIYWMVSTAFKPGQDILTLTPKWFPSPITLQNFQDAVSRAYFLDDVKNSLIIVGAMLVLALTVGFLAAVGAARFGFKGRTVFLVLIIAVQMVPLNSLIIPLYLQLDQIGQVDALPGVIAIYLAAVLPFMIWTLRGFVSNVPVELEEAAMIDGATRFGAFYRVVLPLSAPGVLAAGLYAFTQAWNEFLYALVFITDGRLRTLPVGLASFITGDVYGWGYLMAGAVLTTLPVIAAYIYLQKYMVEGLTAGSVKG